MNPVPFTGHLLTASIFLVTYISWLVFEYVTGKARKSSDPTQKSDRGSYWFLIAMIWVGIFLDFGLVYNLPRAAILWHRTEVFYAGIALMWIGIAFRYYSMRVLGRFFTFQVAVHEGQSVVEAGPYRYIRHPSYAGALITLIGLGLALGNWAGLAAVVGCTMIGYAYRIRVEESALVAAIGEPYREYMGRTRRLIPFVL
jgi:protein-S-isoprenylcysteine O-methyltransferase Ste14